MHEGFQEMTASTAMSAANGTDDTENNAIDNDKGFQEMTASTAISAANDTDDTENNTILNLVDTFSNQVIAVIILCHAAPLPATYHLNRIIK